MERELLTNSLTLKLSTEDNQAIEDSVLIDEPTMKSIEAVYREHGEVIKQVIAIVNAKRMKQLIETATPVEVIGIRHEIVGADNVYNALQKYAEEQKRREENKKQD